jgi:hypothetical protein
VIDETLSALPADFVLDGLLDETDALEDISDVVNSTFLDLKLIGGLVQVDFSRLRSLNESDEFLS